MFFGIPLKSKKVSSNWPRVTELLNSTLRSIFNQTDPDFKVIIACHDLPDVIHADDSRLQILSVDFPPPLYRIDQFPDKYRKREVIAAQVRKEGGGYVMFVDADDLVSKQLVEYVHQDRSPFGYSIEEGWELDYQRRRVRWAPAFHRLCGTCAIINWHVRDLPEVPLDQHTCRFREFVNNNHPTWASVSAAEGRPLKNLPFRGGMYVINNGENATAITNDIGPRRRIVRYLTPSHRIDTKIADEFAIEF